MAFREDDCAIYFMYCLGLGFNGSKVIIVEYMYECVCMHIYLFR